MKGRYLFHVKAGDQHVGRCAAGLQCDSAAFIVCRPYFDFDSLGPGETIERKKVIKEWLVARLNIYINKYHRKLLR